VTIDRDQSPSNDKADSHVFQGCLPREIREVDLVATAKPVELLGVAKKYAITAEL
jgi:hypothetical protein